MIRQNLTDRINRLTFAFQMLGVLKFSPLNTGYALFCIASWVP